MGCRGCDGYATFVEERVGRSDVERYRAKGPDRTTRILLDMIVAESRPEATLLDVGGGIGVIPLELLPSTISRAVLVEASPVYLEAARSLAQEAGVLDRLELKAMDFARHEHEIETADVVTLDRVVCCYPDATALVGASVRRARRLLGIVLPRDRWYARLAIRFENLVWRLRGSAFRAYAHRHAAIERLVDGDGFERRAEATTALWRILLYERPA